MKIIEITPITPWRENKGGTSGLQYHLLVERPSDVEVEMWSFNYNDLTADEIRIVEKELKIEIHLMEKPWFRTWVVDKGLMFVRFLMRYPIFNYIWLSDAYVKEIEGSGADGVWVYGEEMGRVSNQLSEYKRIHTFPDAQSLYYERLGGVPRVIMGAKYRRMERVMDKNAVYHLVGVEDVKWFKKLVSGVDARFIRHPHPQRAGNIETLTQRYWEAMLSGCVMLGRAPQELVDLIGYNPVVDVDWGNPEEQVKEILSNINNYQELVDRNYKAAKEKASWKYRIPMIKEILNSNGYCVNW